MMKMYKYFNFKYTYPIFVYLYNILITRYYIFYYRHFLTGILHENLYILKNNFEKINCLKTISTFYYYVGLFFSKDIIYL